MKQYKKIDTTKQLVTDDLIDGLQADGWIFCGPMEGNKSHVLRFERDAADFAHDSGVILQPENVIKRIKVILN